MLKLYKSMIRSRLENYTAARSGIISENLDYHKRLEYLILVPTKATGVRLERYIIIHVWKIMNGLAPYQYDLMDLSLTSVTTNGCG